MAWWPTEDACPAVAGAQLEFTVGNGAGHTSDVVLHRRDGGLVLEVRDLEVLRGIAGDPWWQRHAEACRDARQVVRVEHDGLHVLTIGEEPLVRLGSWSGAASVTGVADGGEEWCAIRDSNPEPAD